MKARVLQREFSEEGTAHAWVDEMEVRGYVCYTVVKQLGVWIAVVRLRGYVEPGDLRGSSSRVNRFVENDHNCYA